jgi:acetyl esterase/lipase
MSSWQSRLLGAYWRLVVRRRHWGEAPALARRARRLFGAPAALQRAAVLGLHVEPVAEAGGVRGEWLWAPEAAPRAAGVLLYVHGGGYVSCSAATHRPITAALARATRRRVFAVDYRVAPEAPFPAALDDVLAAYRWLVTAGAPGAPVAAAGESAGGGLALLLAQHARDGLWPAPACVAALSPWTDLAGAGASLRDNDGRCDMFRPANIAAFAAAYLGGAAPDDARASPLYGAAHALPPVLLQVGAGELLLDDARRMHERLVAAGGRSRLTVYEGVSHGWQLMAGTLPEATRAVAEIAAFVAEHLAARGAGEVAAQSAGGSGCRPGATLTTSQ